MTDLLFSQEEFSIPSLLLASELKTLVYQTGQFNKGDLLFNQSTEDIVLQQSQK